MVGFSISDIVNLSPPILIASVIWMGTLKKYIGFSVLMSIVGGFAMGLATPWLIQSII